MTKAEEVIEALAPMFRCPICGGLVQATRFWEGYTQPRAAAGDCQHHGAPVWDQLRDLDAWTKAQTRAADAAPIA